MNWFHKHAEWCAHVNYLHCVGLGFFYFFSNLYILLLELCEQPGKVTWPFVSSSWLESIQLPTLSTFCILFFWCSAKCVQLLQIKIQTNQPFVTSVFWTENSILMAGMQSLEKRNSLEEELGKKIHEKVETNL